MYSASIAHPKKAKMNLIASYYKLRANHAEMPPLTRLYHTRFLIGLCILPVQLYVVKKQLESSSHKFFWEKKH